MFTFDAIENSLYNGTSPDNVPDAIKNRFTMYFGSPALDGRLQVKLSENQIRFFYYDSDYPDEKGNDRWDSNGVKDNDYFGEVGFITLTRPKDAGNDILAFPQNIGELRLYDESAIKRGGKEKDIWGSVVDCTENCREVFYDFPFIDEITEKDFSKNIYDLDGTIKIKEKEIRTKEEEIKKSDDKNVGLKWQLYKSKKQLYKLKKQLYNLKEQLYQEKKNLFCCFLRCCLLDFIYEFENRWQSFGSSPLYDTVRNKLRESDAYKTLTAKIHYKQYLYKGEHWAGNKEKYTYYTQKFADCLMSNRINKVISPNSYFHRVRWGNGNDYLSYQGWFYNPEEELEAILDQNRKQEEQSFPCLDANLVLKIRNFLYTKHSVYQAMTRSAGKQFFIGSQVLMCITSIIILCSSIWGDCADLILHMAFPTLVFVVGWCAFCRKIADNPKNQIWGYFPSLVLVLAAFGALYFKKLWLWHSFDVVVVVCIIFWIYCSGYFNNPDTNRHTNGVIYALLPRILVAELAAWLTIGIADDLVKSMLWVGDKVMIVGVVLGVIILVAIILLGEAKQHSPYKSLRTNFYQKVTPIMNHSLFFALVFGIMMQGFFYNNLIKNSDVMANTVFNDYFDAADYYCQNLEDLSQITDQYKIHCDQSDLKDLSMYSEGKSTQIHRVNDSVEILTTIRINNKTDNNSEDKPEQYNDIVDRFNKIVEEIKLLYGRDSVNSSMFKSLERMPSCSTDTAKIRKVKDTNNKMIEGFPPLLQEEISNVRRNILKFNNYDTLMNWASIGNSPDYISTGSAYLDSLTKKAAGMRTCCRKIKVECREKPIKLFPTLLIFHTLIVLVIAFVTQLLITDKTVTEPL